MWFHDHPRCICDSELKASRLWISEERHLFWASKACWLGGLECVSPCHGRTRNSLWAGERALWVAGCGWLTIGVCLSRRNLGVDFVVTIVAVLSETTGTKPLQRQEKGILSEHWLWKSIHGASCHVHVCQDKMCHTLSSETTPFHQVSHCTWWE